MQGVARNFFTMAVIYAVLGLTLGLSMAMSHDHGQRPTHAHIMVLGLVMFSIFAFFYHLVPAARNSRLATIHFWLAAVSSVVMLITLYMLYGGNESVEPVLGVASLVYFAATILFAYIALSALWRSEGASAADRVPAE
jgi:cbb3-type cytochrome oxidase subunit 1